MIIKYIFVASLLIVMASEFASGDRIVLDGYAATVGKSIVTVGEVKEEMQRGNREIFRAMQAGQAVSEQQIEAIYLRALENLVGEALIVEEFRRLEEDGKVQLPDEAVDNSIQSIINERYTGNRSDLFRDLRKSGISFSDFRQQQRRSLKLMIMRNQKFSSGVDVSPGRLRRLYEERRDQYKIPGSVDLSLIMLDYEDSPDALDLVDSIAEEIRAGADFAELAREHSVDRMASEGGYRGGMNPDHLRAEIREAISGMSVGDIAGPIRSGDHWYIVKLHELRAAGFRPLAEAKVELERELRERKMHEMMQAWIEQLKEVHYVNRYPLPELL